MRSAALLTSALAIGAIAKPLQKRYIVTEVDLEIKTVTVYVTPGAPEPTAEAYPTVTAQGHRGHGSSSSASTSSCKTPAPASSSSSSSPVYVAPPSTSTYVYTPTPTPEPTPEPQSVSVVSSQAPASSSSPSTGDHPTGEIQATLTSGADYQAAVLYHHNAARSNHGAGPLVWDTTCEANARKAAQNCVFEHTFLDGTGEGQNLFTVSGDSFNVTAGITESWYKGEFEAMSPYWGAADIPEAVFHSVGHLTAMLWKKTTKVGCVSYDCSGRMKLGDGSATDMDKFTVCNYAEAGNYAGEYGQNVGSPISTTNLGSWLD